MFSHSGSTLMIVGGSIPRGVLENRRLFLYVCCEPLVGVLRADHHGGEDVAGLWYVSIFLKEVRILASPQISAAMRRPTMFVGPRFGWPYEGFMAGQLRRSSIYVVRKAF